MQVVFCSSSLIPNVCFTVIGLLVVLMLVFEAQRRKQGLKLINVIHALAEQGRRLVCTQAIQSVDLK